MENQELPRNSRLPRKLGIVFLALATVATALAATALFSRRADPQTGLILDVFDLVGRYFVDKPDRREMTVDALAGLVDHLKKEVQNAAAEVQIKAFLEARERGENPTPPSFFGDDDEVSPTPIPTPYDAVEVKSTPAASPTHVELTTGAAKFARDLPNDKRTLARVIVDGVEFCRVNLRLPQSRDELLQLALDAMMYRLDPHSGFLNLHDYRSLQQETQGLFGGIGVEIGMRNAMLLVIAPLEGTPAARAGLQSQDRIVAIDREETLGHGLEWGVSRIRGRVGTPVTLTIRRTGVAETFDVTLVRANIEAVAVKSKLLPGRIGWVRLMSFNARTEDDLDQALRDLDAANGGMRALILDMRRNPGGLLEQAVAVADRFLASGLIVNTIGRGYLPERERFATGRGQWTKVPMILLVDPGSASASEIVAGALKDHERALVLGFQTFGKGSVQSIFELPNENGLRLTTAMYYTPSGASIQEFGITPHIRLRVAHEENDPWVSEAQLRQSGNFKSRSRGKPPAPDLEVDVNALADYALAKGWVKKERDDFNDDNDLTLAFATHLLTGDDFSIPTLIAHAKAIVAQFPPAK